MAVVRNLLVRAGADFSELQKEMQKAQKYMASAGKQITNIGKTLTLGITAPIIGIGIASVNAASDLAEVQNVIDTAFGDSAKKVNEWSKTAIESFGLSELQAKQFAGTMRAMLGSMGLTSSEADNMSLSLSSLAGDMASFYNLDPSEAFEKLRSGISGETEPLKQLGINMSVANMEAYALTKGINTSWKEMSAAEQATLRYNYIMDTTKMAQGDFAKTNTGFANSMRVVKEQLVSVGANLSSILLPYLEKFLGKVRELLTWFQNLSPETQKMIVKFALIAAAVGPVLLVIGKLSSSLSSVLIWGKGVAGALAGVQAGTKGVGAIFSAVFGPGGIVLLIIAGVALLVGAFIYLWNNCDAFRNFFINMWNAIVSFMTPILTTIKDFIVNTWNSIWSTLEPILIALKDTIISAWNYVWETLQPIIEGLKNMFSAAWEFISTVTKIVWEGIKAYFSTWFNILKGIFEVFVSVVKWIWENFGDIIVQKFKIAWDTVVSVFGGVVKVVTGIFDFFTGLLTGNWEKCWEGIKNVVVGVWEGIKAVVKGGINFLIGALNGFIRGINKVKVPSWIPGIGGMGINIPEIPYLAKGTDYFQGGLAIVGEEGPELVSMPTGSKVTPNKETMNILGNKDMQFNFIMDGREFARILAKYNGEEQATFNLRTGGAY
ncbi:hypothetical protein PMY56_13650 [Clostridium tertium]|uniref:hypothetical protein n=1 Tax=Clostridium tertium TaxID=1559 RepID=UPI00232E4D5C|nr:hypothetical protein [Clostridium tertium]MDB1924057.1 hypothetical protein [Clostridium tertium]MDB1927182.1 hypothetical protein [Clostridium tertium]MDB1930959.1 hypothetical protein [Clostridium tertium]